MLIMKKDKQTAVGVDKLVELSLTLVPLFLKKTVNPFMTEADIT